MNTILVTGGTGHLGRDLVPELQRAGHRVRVLARTPGRDPNVEWVKGDLSTGQGIAEAMAGVDMVVNAATNSPIARRGGFRMADFFRSPSDVDLEGTRRLIAEARRAGVRRFTHASIVAIDRTKYPYARVKFAGEMLVRESGLEWSVVRATPFYYLIEGSLSGLVGMPIWPLPTRIPFQPCDSADFAKYLARCATDGELGMRQDFGGPEVLAFGELARQFQAARGIRRPIIHLPLGPLARALEPMFPTAPGGARGTTTWSAWLNQRAHEHREAQGAASA